MTSIDWMFGMCFGFIYKGGYGHFVVELKGIILRIKLIDCEDLKLHGLSSMSMNDWIVFLWNKSSMRKHICTYGPIFCETHGTYFCIFYLFCEQTYVHYLQ